MWILLTLDPALCPSVTQDLWGPLVTPFDEKEKQREDQNSLIWSYYSLNNILKSKLISRKTKPRFYRTTKIFYFWLVKQSIRPTTDGSENWALAGLLEATKT